MICAARAGDCAPAGSGRFDIRDSLSVTRVLGRPRPSPDGSAVAYVAGDWQRGDSILAHKPLGRLIVRSLEAGGETELATRASDPVWSGAGNAIAWFSGLGAGRELVVAFLSANGPESRRFPVAGELSRYSARHFPPVWSDGDRFLVVAEAELRDAKPPADRPYTISSHTARTVLDAHFRDDTLWRLVRIDPASAEKSYLTPPAAIRRIAPGPDGEEILLEIARTDAPGNFVGDRYVQPRRYEIVSPRDGAVRALDFDPAASSLHWRNARTIVAKSAGKLSAIDVRTGETNALLPRAVLTGRTGFTPGEEAIALRTPVPERDDSVFVIAPPAPHRLQIGELPSGMPRTVVDSDAGVEILGWQWLPDGKRLVVHARELATLTERIHLWTGTELRSVLEAELAIGPLATVSSDVLVFAAESAVMPAELFLLDLATGDLRQISRLNRRFADFDFRPPLLVGGAAAGGSAWRGLFYDPRGERSSAVDLPLVVRAYARQTDRRNVFDAEAQMHLARGYSYLAPDVFPLRGTLHEAYVEILPAAIGQTRRRHGLSGGTGYVGGSLGGYAGLALLTATRIVDAAVLRAPPAEFALSWATGKDRDADLLEHLMLGDTPHRNPEAYRLNSPFWKADRIRAPTLFLHGTDDAQVPVEHSQWVFQTMRRTGAAPAALRLYPDGDHKIVRGNEGYYIDIYEQIFGWWERHLDGGER